MEMIAIFLFRRTASLGCVFGAVAVPEAGLGAEALEEVWFPELFFELPEEALARASRLGITIVSE